MENEIKRGIYQNYTDTDITFTYSREEILNI